MMGSSEVPWVGRGVIGKPEDGGSGSASERNAQGQRRRASLPTFLLLGYRNILQAEGRLRGRRRERDEKQQEEQKEQKS